MTQAIITARLDPDDVKDFDEFCSKVGIDSSVAINLFVKAVLREKRIPFEIALVEDPFFLDTNLAYLKKSVQELRSGKGTAHDLIED